LTLIHPALIAFSDPSLFIKREAKKNRLKQKHAGQQELTAKNKQRQTALATSSYQLSGDQKEKRKRKHKRNLKNKLKPLRRAPGATRTAKAGASGQEMRSARTEGCG
jgi:hypothetical protein